MLDSSEEGLPGSKDIRSWCENCDAGLEMRRIMANRWFNLRISITPSLRLVITLEEDANPTKVVHLSAAPFLAFGIKLAWHVYTHQLARGVEISWRRTVFPLFASKSPSPYACVMRSLKKLRKAIPSYARLVLKANCTPSELEHNTFNLLLPKPALWRFTFQARQARVPPRSAVVAAAETVDTAECLRQILEKLPRPDRGRVYTSAEGMVKYCVLSPPQVTLLCQLASWPPLEIDADRDKPRVILNDAEDSCLDADVAEFKENEIDTSTEGALAHLQCPVAKEQQEPQPASTTEFRVSSELAREMVLPSESKLEVTTSHSISVTAVGDDFTHFGGILSFELLAKGDVVLWTSSHLIPTLLVEAQLSRCFAVELFEPALVEVYFRPDRNGPRTTAAVMTQRARSSLTLRLAGDLLRVGLAQTIKGVNFTVILHPTFLYSSKKSDWMPLPPIKCSVRAPVADDAPEFVLGCDFLHTMRPSLAYKRRLLCFHV